VADCDYRLTRGYSKKHRVTAYFKSIAAIWPGPGTARPVSRRIETGNQNPKCCDSESWAARSRPPPATNRAPHRRRAERSLIARDPDLWCRCVDITFVEARSASPHTGHGLPFQCGSSQIVSWQISR
jgi:hypothetical protein